MHTSTSSSSPDRATGQSCYVNNDSPLITLEMYSALPPVKWTEVTRKIFYGPSGHHGRSSRRHFTQCASEEEGGGVGGGSSEQSVGAGQDKINGSDRECRRQQEIQSRPINNIPVRQQLPPPQPPPPCFTRRLGPLDYWPPRGGWWPPAAQYTSHTGPALTSCLHLLDIHLSACV